eukprot:3620618-Prymnesium_polylepis.2
MDGRAVGRRALLQRSSFTDSLASKPPQRAVWAPEQPQKWHRVQLTPGGCMLGPRQASDEAVGVSIYEALIVTFKEPRDGCEGRAAQG